jgi:VanZ like protein
LPQQSNRQKITSLVQYWVPVIAYAGLIFYFSSVPRPEEVIPFTIWDKAAHALEYAILGLLCYRAMSNASPPWGIRRSFALSIAIAVLYGATDELHQVLVPPREADLLDIFADSIGALIGATAWRWVTNSPAGRQGTTC